MIEAPTKPRFGFRFVVFGRHMQVQQLQSGPRALESMLHIQRTTSTHTHAGTHLCTHKADKLTVQSVSEVSARPEFLVLAEL